MLQQAAVRFAKRARELLMREDARFGMLAVVGVVAVLGVFAFAPDAHAQFPSLEDAQKWALALLGQIISIIISFLGSLLIILINVLIAVAKYSNFVDAQPVEMGWRLVRDIVNMFFIVILLLSAFATIIRYQEFHYTKVLPKLLLMAILINFSKTLIGLMIDFSQVLMLTFVNAFAQAAGGNFVTLLQLNLVTKLKDNFKNPGDIYDILNLLPAGILAIVMLSISLTVIVIMVLFLVVRIVGLWLLLIMSPMAFFALAMPGKLQKAFGAFTNDFWDRLGTFLIAGPVMAFFLWLALAVAQTPGSKPFEDTVRGVDASGEASDAASSAGFPTAIGDTAGIGTFIVAIVLLMQGVEFAVKSAGAVSSRLGSFAKDISQGGGVVPYVARQGYRYGKPVAVAGARVGWGATKLAGKGVGKGAAGLFNAVDKRKDLRGKLGSAGMAVTGAMGLAVGGDTFAKLQGYRGRKEAEAGKELTATRSGLSVRQQIEYLKGQTNSSDPHRAAEAKQQLAALVAGSLGQKKFAEVQADKVYFDPQDTAFIRENMGDEGDKALKEAFGEADAQRETAKYMADGMKAASESGDDKGVQEFKDAIQKNGAFADIDALVGLASNRQATIPKHLEKVGAPAFADSGSAMANLMAIQALDENGDFDVNSEGYRALEKRGGQSFALAKAHLERMSAEEKAKWVKALTPGADAQTKKDAEASRAHMKIAKNGDFIAVSRNRDEENNKHRLLWHKSKEGVAAANKAAQQQMAAAETERSQRIQEISARLRSTAASAGEASQSTESVRRELFAAGGKVQDAFRFDKASGRFDSGDDRVMFDAAVDSIRDRMEQGNEQVLSEIEALDTGTLRENADSYNEARAAFAKRMTPQALERAYQTSRATNNAKAQQKLDEIMDIIEGEADRVKSKISKANLRPAEVQSVVTNRLSPEAGQAVDRLVRSGFKTENEAEEAAHAAVLARAARQIRGEVSPRAARRVQERRGRAQRPPDGNA